MPTIIEADGTTAYVPGIVIETEADRLQGLAMQAQAEWHQHPTSLTHKAEYGLRLRHWANETGNQRALTFALQLEKECEDAAQASVSAGL